MTVWTCFSVLGYFVVFLLLLILSVAFSGHEARAYNTLAAYENVIIADQPLTVGELAAKHAPEYLLNSANPSPPLLWIWYEAVPTTDTIDLIYYAVWENEINPEPIIDKGYALFRAAYYGYPLRDIEFTQLSIDRSSGEVVGLLFETSPGDDYFVRISEHLTARYTRQESGAFTETLTTRAGAPVAQQADVPVIFRQTHPQIYVQTWNHLSRLLKAEDENLEKLEAELRELQENDYRQYKFSRKSQGDHKTQANPLTLPLTFLATLFFVLLPGGFYVLFNRLFKKQDK